MVQGCQETSDSQSECFGTCVALIWADFSFHDWALFWKFLWLMRNQSPILSEKKSVPMHTTSFFLIFQQWAYHTGNNIVYKFSAAWLWCIEVQHSDWLKQVTWIGTPTQRALFLRGIVILFIYNTGWMDLNGPTQASFLFILSLFKKQNNFYNKSM